MLASTSLQGSPVSCRSVVIPSEIQGGLPRGGEGGAGTAQVRASPILSGEALAHELLQAVGAPALATQEIGFSIRIPKVRERTKCSRCGKSFEAGGPTGFEAELPVCDPCLLEGSPLLGLLLALAAVTRSYGAFRSEKTEEQRLALMDYGAFARIYEHITAKEGPARPFFLDGLPGGGIPGEAPEEKTTEEE